MVAGRAFPDVDWIGTLSEETLMNSPVYEQIKQRGREEGARDAVRRAIVELVRSQHGRAPRRLTQLLASIEGVDRLHRLLVEVGSTASAEEAIEVLERSEAPRRASARGCRRPR